MHPVSSFTREIIFEKLLVSFRTRGIFFFFFPLNSPFNFFADNSRGKLFELSDRYKFVEQIRKFFPEREQAIDRGQRRKF